MTHPERLEQAVRAALHAKADGLTAPDAIKQRLDTALAQQRPRTAPRWRRRLVACAVCAAVLVGGAFAGSAMLSISGHSWSDQRMSWQDTAAAAQEIAPALALPQQLGDFAFTRGLTVENTVDYGASSQAFEELSVEYEAGGAMLSLNLRPENELLDSQTTQPSVQPAHETLQVEGISMTYYEIEHLFLPPEEKPSAEQLQAQAEGRLNIAYGAAQPERACSQSLLWEQDGVVYELFGFDLDLSRDAMAALAQQIVRGQTGEQP